VRHVRPGGTTAETQSESVTNIRLHCEVNGGGGRGRSVSSGRSADRFAAMAGEGNVRQNSLSEWQLHKNRIGTRYETSPIGESRTYKKANKRMGRVVDLQSSTKAKVKSQAVHATQCRGRGPQSLAATSRCWKHA
jgi:hypothetical protein